jgi:hypothetical protein
MPDSAGGTDRFVLKLDINGNMIWKKYYRTSIKGGCVFSVIIAKNGDYIIGGEKYAEPWIARIDTIGNIKWETWLYDTVNKEGSVLSKAATINYLRETSRGTIVCAAGDEYPNASSDYAAYLEFDSLGALRTYTEWQNVTGYNVGGFSVEETRGGQLLFGGYEAVYYLDTVGNEEWKKKYTFQLEGVGSEVCEIYRVKVLRDNTPFVMGRAYEANCWTDYEKLYYDGWWSPIGYASGLNSAWDTGGKQGGDDHLYDFTQLKNGNLVFVGNWAYTGGNLLLWIIVTDSTGKNKYWEKQIVVDDVVPYSVCATEDSGFTIVGSGGVNTDSTGFDAVAVHFVPKDPTAVITKAQYKAKTLTSIRTNINRSRLTIECNEFLNSKSEVSVFDLTGRCLAVKTGNNKIVMDISHISQGTYLLKVKTGNSIKTKKLFVKN